MGSRPDSVSLRVPRLAMAAPSDHGVFFAPEAGRSPPGAAGGIERCCGPHGATGIRHRGKIALGRAGLRSPGAAAARIAGGCCGRNQVTRSRAPPSSAYLLHRRFSIGLAPRAACRRQVGLC